MIHTDGRPTIANAPVKLDLPEDPETPDFVIERDGDLFLIAAVTPLAVSWLEDNVEPDAQYFGKRLAVEIDYVLDLVQGACDAGFTVV